MNLPKDPAKYNTFVLKSGYMESNSIGSLVVSHIIDFGEEEEETWQEAWWASFHHFAQVFQAVVKVHNGIHVEGLEWVRSIPRCCDKQLVSDVGSSTDVAYYCPTCGSNLLQYKIEEVDKDTWIHMTSEFLAMTINSTIDTWPSEYEEVFSGTGWRVGYTDSPGIVSFINGSAESLLSDLELAKKSHLWSDKKEFFNNVSFRQLADL